MCKCKWLWEWGVFEGGGVDFRKYLDLDRKKVPELQSRDLERGSS